MSPDHNFRIVKLHTWSGQGEKLLPGCRKNVDVDTLTVASLGMKFLGAVSGD